MGDRNGKKPKGQFTGGGGKSPQARASVPAGKTPAQAPVSTQHEKPSWRFSMLDRGGRWGWDKATSSHLALIHQKLCDFETMTMQELFGDRKAHKAIPTEDLRHAVRSRLTELGRDDETSLVEFRLGYSERLFGIRRANVIYVLWWDPEHDVFK